MTGIVERRTLRLVLTVFFVALLAAVRLLNRFAGDAGRGQSGQADPIARYGFHLDEVASRAGLDFVHQGPTFDERLRHIMPQVASMGAAVSVADFDRDGWHDLYVTNSA